MSGELQGVAGGRGELRCLGGETDTCVSVCSIGVCLFVKQVAPIALGAWSMALVYGCHLSIIITKYLSRL